jgi:hypothetical protein
LTSQYNVVRHYIQAVLDNSGDKEALIVQVFELASMLEEERRQRGILNDELHRSIERERELVRAIRTERY